MKKISTLILLTIYCCGMSMQAQVQKNMQLSQLTIKKTAARFIMGYHFAGDTATQKGMYLQKSKNQRTIGWVMLGGGVAMAVAGGTMFSNNFHLFSSANDSEAQAGGILFLTGIGCSLGSIPLFISAANNARKAASITVSNQQIIDPQHLTVRLQPTISIKFSL